MEPPAHFFRQSPFSAAPSAERFCPVGPAEQARQRLLQCINRAEGPALLVGPAGTGKTILCQTLVQSLEDAYDVVFLAESRLCTRRALLQHMLFHLELPYRGMSEGELRLSLIDRLGSSGVQPSNPVLLVVDEAHTLPFRLLEELRMISGVVRDGSPRVRMVLAGGMGLEERLADPRLESLSQRIGARCYLHPLHRDETRQYIEHHFDRMGDSTDARIEPAAVGAVYRATDGIPRLINQLMDRAVVLAEQRALSRIDEATVAWAWSDLQQLPAPFTAEPASQPRDAALEAVVEFGSLDDEPAGPAHYPAEPVPAVPSPVSEPLAADYESLAAESFSGYEEESEETGLSAADPNLCFEFEATGPTQPSCDEGDIANVLAEAPEQSGGEAIVCPPGEPDLDYAEPSQEGPEDAPSAAPPSPVPCETIPYEPLACEPIVEEIELPSDMPPSAAGDAESLPSGTAGALGRRLPEPAVKLPFGDDFFDEIEVGSVLRLSLNEPAESCPPQDASADTEGGALEDALCREVIRLNSAVAHHAGRDEEHWDADVLQGTGSIADISLADDSDLLVVEEDIPERPAGTAAERARPAGDLDYRDLFSKLRQG